MSRRKGDADAGTRTGGPASAQVSVVRSHRFAAIDVSLPVTIAPAVDFAVFNVTLAKALTKLMGQCCLVSPQASTDGERAGEFVWYSTGSDWVGIALAATLAEALVSQRCGGDLTGSDGLHSDAASVRSLHDEIVAAILGAAAANWLTPAVIWSAATLPVPGLPLPALHAMTIGLGALSWPVMIALALASKTPLASVPEGWSDELRHALDYIAFPVRAVLFETRLPLAKAVQLRPGDVLPIETARDVGLRVGTHRLGSGTIAPTGDGGHLVTIAASARSFCVTAKEASS